MDAKLAYIKPNISGIYWLKLNALEKPIKFRILERHDKDLFVSLKYAQKPKLNLNEELISRGLATVVPKTTFYNKTQKQMFYKFLKLQFKAQKAGTGIWESSYKTSKLNNLVNSLVVKPFNVILGK